MGKTSKKVSWRTVMRQAAQASTASEAKRLRLRAADMRREEREAAASSLAKTKKHIVRKVAGKAKKRSAAVKAMLTHAAASRVFPGKGDLTGYGGAADDNKLFYGVDTELQSRAMVVEARKKHGGEEAIRNRLAEALAVARFEGQREAERKAREVAKQVRENNDEKIIRGFLAKMEVLEMYKRSVPASVIVDGYTLSKIIDALHAAGYSTSGRVTDTEAATSNGQRQWRAVLGADTNE